MEAVYEVRAASIDHTSIRRLIRQTRETLIGPWHVGQCKAAAAYAAEQQQVQMTTLRPEVDTECLSDKI
jgi:hypothetical protein